MDGGLWHAAHVVMRLDGDSRFGMFCHHVLEHLRAEHFPLLVVTQQPQSGSLVIGVIGDADVIASALLNAFLLRLFFLLGKDVVVFVALIIDVTHLIIILLFLLIFRTIDVSNLSGSSRLCVHPTIIIFCLVDSIFIGQLCSPMSAWNVSGDQELFVLWQVGVPF